MTHSTRRWSGCLPAALLARERTDVLAKSTGAAQFGIDVRLPDMLYAAIRMVPAFGGSWRLRICWRAAVD